MAELDLPLRRHQASAQPPVKRSSWYGVGTFIAGILLLIGILLKTTIASSQFFTRTIMSDQAVLEIQQGLNRSFTNRAIFYSLSPDLTRDLLTTAQIRTDLKQGITNLYAGKKDFVPIEQITDQITKNFDQRLASAGNQQSEEIDAAFKRALVSDLQQLADNRMKGLGFDKLVPYLQTIQQATMVLLVSGSVGLLIMGIITLWRTRSLLWLAYYWGWAGLVSGGLSWGSYSLLHDHLMALNLTPNTGVAATIVADLVPNFLDQWQILNYLWLGISMVLLLVGLIYLVRDKRRKK